VTDFDIVASAEELEITTTRPDGTLRPWGPIDAAVEAAYRAKYARYGRTYLEPMLAARAATLRLAPR
jgi:hypothetical protein